MTRELGFEGGNYPDPDEQEEQGGRLELDGAKMLSGTALVQSTGSGKERGRKRSGVKVGDRQARAAMANNLALRPICFFSK